MRDPAEFDTFYRDARGRLLLQTYSLTGDLGASRSAVRDAFLVAWHHWRKVAHLPDPEAAVRPYAWRHAQRRTTARLWHREKEIGPGAKETLEALGKLPVTQRKTLLLTQLAAVSMPQMAREVGLPLDEAERELQSATAQFSLLRGVPAAGIRTLFEPLGEIVNEVTWPRSTIIRRAGAARRRTHTALGAVAAVAAFALTGTLVTDAAGVRPTLDRQPVSAGPSAEAPTKPRPAQTLPKSAMLAAPQLDRAFGGDGWSVGRTGDNSAGSGMVLPCQQERYADPRGEAAWVRTFEPPGKAGGTPLPPTALTEAAQLTEASGTRKAARRSFQALLGWFAGCADARSQLLVTREVAGAGDEAAQLVLRSWEDPVTTYVVGLARTGLYTTTTLSTVAGAVDPDVDASGRLLSAAVDSLCELPGGGECAGDAPQLTVRGSYPTGPAPSILSEVDLPPVSSVTLPWVGTEPRRAGVNVAATRCDDTAFTGDVAGGRFSNNFTRSYVIPEADLPAEFGITETVGSLPGNRAPAFVDEVRADLARCPDQDLGTEVVETVRLDEADTAMTAWQLTTELSDDRSFTYAMAIMRQGRSVAQVTFIAADGVQMAEGAFTDLAYRALDRLEQMPPPRRQD